MTNSAGVVLDAGVFIALERQNRAVVAHAWRGGTGRQVPVAFLLRRTSVVALDKAVARTLGRMLGQSQTADPIDTHLVLLARERGWPVLTSDAGDLLAIDPSLSVEKI